MQLFPDATYHLFEPQADIAPEYQQTMTDFIGNTPNAILHKMAVGSENGTVKFSVAEDPVGSTSIKPGAPQLYEQVEAQLTTLDSMIDQGTPIPQFVKMDIQAAELEALRGFEKHLNQVDLLLLETWLSRGYGENTPLIHELIEFLLPHGFRMFELGGCYRNQSGSLNFAGLLLCEQGSQLRLRQRFSLLGFVARSRIGSDRIGSHHRINKSVN